MSLLVINLSNHSLTVPYSFLLCSYKAISSIHSTHDGPQSFCTNNYFRILKTDEQHSFFEKKKKSQPKQQQQKATKKPQTKTFANLVVPRVVIAIKHVHQKSNATLGRKPSIFLLIFTYVNRKLHKALKRKMHCTKLKV